MSTRRMQWSALVVAGALIGASMAQLRAAPPAEAVPGLVRVLSPPSADNSSRLKMASAVCPANKRVIGGGAWIHDRGGGKVMLAQLQPVRNAQSADRFDVIAQEPGAGYAGNWWVRAYALCALPLPGLGVVFRSSPFSSTRFKAVEARCPTGTRALSAGSLVAAPGGGPAPDVGLQLVRPSGSLDIARATAREDPGGSTASWAIAAYVVCANPIAGVTTTAKVGSGVRSAATVCPANTFVHGAGGGGSVTDSGRVYLQVVFPSVDLRRVRVDMTAAPPAGMVAQAVCAPA